MGKYVRINNVCGPQVDLFNRTLKVINAYATLFRRVY